MEQNDPPTKKVQEKYRGNSTRSDLNPGPGKDKGLMPQEDKETDPTIVVSSDEDRQKDQEEEHTREEEPPSVSPRRRERKIYHNSYHPKPSHLPTPHLKMMTGKQKISPGLVTPDEDQDTMTTQERKSPEVPANQDADKDFFHDSERQLVVQQKFGSEMKPSPLGTLRLTLTTPLTKLGDMINKATPVYEGFWKDKDSDILSRLDAGLRKIKRQKRQCPEGSP